MQNAFVFLQCVLLALFLAQDTVPMPPLNDLAAEVKFLGWKKIILGTALTSGLVALSLILAIRYSGAPLPVAAKIFFFLWWGMMMLGMYTSWYKPYFFGPTPKELEMYHALFARTHTLLPPRNGFAGPNTLHLVILHPLMIACAVLAYLKMAGVF
jgi:hypothetical protein